MDYELTKNPVADWLAIRIYNKFTNAKDADKNESFVIPVCSEELAIQIQLRLILKTDLMSVLVCNNNYLKSLTMEKASHLKITTPDKTVSYRKGSIVYILFPGVLPEMPQSIIGSGGTNKELEFDESWPLKGNITEFYSMLDWIASEHWDIDIESSKQIKQLLENFIFPSIKAEPAGHKLLLDDLLLRPTLSNIKNFKAEEFAFLSGIPWDDTLQSLKPTKSFTKKKVDGLASILRKDIISDEDIIETISRIFPDATEDESQKKRNDLITFYDGVYSLEQKCNGFLALSNGFKYLRDKYNYDSTWLNFKTLNRIAGLDTNSTSAEIDHVSLIGSVYSYDNNAIINDSKTSYELKVNYQVSDVVDRNLLCSVRVGRKIIDRKEINNNSGTYSINLSFTELLECRKKSSMSSELIIEILLDSEVLASRKLICWSVSDSEYLMGMINHLDEEIIILEGGEESTNVVVTSPLEVFLVFDVKQLKHPYLDLGHKTSIQFDNDNLESLYTSQERLLPDNLRYSENIAILFSDYPDMTLNLELGSLSAGFSTLDLLFENSIYTNNTKSRTQTLNIFKGVTSSPKYNLGCTAYEKNKFSLARVFESNVNDSDHLPLIVDLFNKEKSIDAKVIPHPESNWLRVSSNTKLISLGSQKIISEPLTKLISEYKSCRDNLLHFLKSRIDKKSHITSTHPYYSFLPIFIDNDSDSEFSVKLISYITCYEKILNYVTDTGKEYWLERFVATNLDCVVSSSNSTNLSDLKLMSPWHPLVLCNRYFYQKNLCSYAEYHNKYDRQRSSYLNSKLVKLLRKATLFHVAPHFGLDINTNAIIKACNDPAWMISMPQTFLDYTNELSKTNLHEHSEIITAFNITTGLELFKLNIQGDTLVTNTIEQYLKTNPQFRRLGIRAGTGYDYPAFTSVVKKMMIDNNDKLTDFSKKLPGGLDLYFDGLNVNDDINWSNELAESDINITVSSISDSFKHIDGVDVNFISSSSASELQLLDETKEHQVMRGVNSSFIFSWPMKYRNETRSSIDSIKTLYEPEILAEKDELQAVINKCLLKLQSKQLSGSLVQEVTKGVLPSNPTAPWEVIPAIDLDPALVARYLSVNSDRQLWDYKYKISDDGGSTHFVISKSSSLVEKSLSKLLPNEIDITAVLAEMANIGSPLLRESNGSINKAKGCIGLCAAKRLFPLHLFNKDGFIALIISVDSFNQIIGYESESTNHDTVNTKMSDLFALIIKTGDHASPLEISGVAIEAKYRTNINEKSGTKWMKQARDTYNRVESLVTNAKEFLPDRIALCEILDFAISLSNPYSETDYKQVMRSVVEGNFVWSQSINARALVIATSPKCESNSDFNTYYPDGVMVHISTQDFPDSDLSNNLFTSDFAESYYNLLVKGAYKPHKEESDNHYDTKAIKTDESNQANESGEDKELHPEELNDTNEISSEAPISTTKIVTDVSSSDDSNLNVSSNISTDDNSKILLKNYILTKDVLSENGILVKNTPVDTDGMYLRETPSCWRYAFDLESGRDLQKTDRREILDQIKLALHLDQSLKVTQKVHKGLVIYEIPKNEEDKYSVFAEDLWVKWGTYHDNSVLRAPIGESAVDGEIIVIDFSSLPHLLVGGTTGGGKSVAIETMLGTLVKFYKPAQLDISIIDFKYGADYQNLDEFPHVNPICTDPDGSLVLLERAVSEMRRRMKLFPKSGVRDLKAYNEQAPESEKLPFKLIVVDEYKEMQVYAKDIIDKIEDQITSLAQLGRSAGVHLIICTQYPRADVVSPIIKTNMTGRLCLKVSSHNESNVILNESGAEKLGKKGDGIYHSGAKGPERMQCAVVKDWHPEVKK